MVLLAYHSLCLVGYCCYAEICFHFLLLLQPCLTYIHLHYIAPILWSLWRGLLLWVDTFMLSTCCLAALLIFRARNIVAFHSFSLYELNLSLLLLVQPSGIHPLSILYLFFGLRGLFTKKTLCHAYYKTVLMLDYQPWQRYTPRVLFKFFSGSLNMKIPLSITFSKLENNSMEEDHRLSFNLFFGVIKTKRKRNHIECTSISLLRLLKHEME